MLISQLPPDLRKLAEQRRQEYETQNTPGRFPDQLVSAFVWAFTEEGDPFWEWVMRTGTAPDGWQPSPLS